jgi:hypothetical protein
MHRTARREIRGGCSLQRVVRRPRATWACGKSEGHTKSERKGRGSMHKVITTHRGRQKRWAKDPSLRVRWQARAEGRHPTQANSPACPRCARPPTSLALQLVQSLGWRLCRSAAPTSPARQGPWAHPPCPGWTTRVRGGGPRRPCARCVGSTVSPVLGGCAAASSHQLSSSSAPVEGKRSV